MLFSKRQGYRQLATDEEVNPTTKREDDGPISHRNTISFKIPFILLVTINIFMIAAGLTWNRGYSPKTTIPSQKIFPPGTYIIPPHLLKSNLIKS